MKKTIQEVTVRCKSCNKIQSSDEVRVYDDLCRKCFEISMRPDEDHPDQGLDPIYVDEGWEQDG